MDATAWTVVGPAVAILAAIDASFRALRSDLPRLRAQGDEIRKHMTGLRERIAHLEGLLSNRSPRRRHEPRGDPNAA